MDTSPSTIQSVGCFQTPINVNSSSRIQAFRSQSSLVHAIGHATTNTDNASILDADVHSTAIATLLSTAPLGFRLSRAYIPAQHTCTLNPFIRFVCYVRIASVGPLMLIRRSRAINILDGVARLGESFGHDSVKHSGMILMFCGEIRHYQSSVGHQTSKTRGAAGVGFGDKSSLKSPRTNNRLRCLKLSRL